MRIAIIGTGVSGLVCAHLLGTRHDIVVYESDVRAGGHANTVTARLAGCDYPVDTGFIVYNERNYPVFSQMLRELGVVTRESEMSFSVSDKVADVEWCGSGPRELFAQRRNLTRPEFWRMLRDVTRFNREMTNRLELQPNYDISLETYLSDGKWSRGFLDWYLIPMGSAIWSANPESFTDFPVDSLARFFFNHGLLGVRDRPTWRTIVGGSTSYVQAITKALGGRLRLGTRVDKVVRRDRGVEIATSSGGLDNFDHVIIATHSDQALSLLSDPSTLESEILGAIGYQANSAVLHTDTSILPERTKARASWNWHRRPGADAPTLTYDLSRLQGIDSPVPLLLTLNERELINPKCVIQEFEYAHPVFDTGAIKAQQRHGEISGRNGISFAGAYWGYGFHEDGAASAWRVCQALGATDSRDV